MMRRPRAPYAILLATSAIAVACNALTGVGDLGSGPCVDCAGAEDARRSDALVVTDGPDPTDAPADTAALDASDGGRPSYCEGIVLYAAFDGTYATAQGGAPDIVPTDSFVPGKFGSSVLCSGFGPNQGIFYPTGAGGAVYPKAAGTFAIWFKPTWKWPSNADRTLVKPSGDRGNGLNGAGPHLRYLSPEDSFGFVNQNPDGGFVQAAAPAAQLTPYWNDQAWNHVAGTWNQAGPITLTFTLNGASGDPSITHRESSLGWVPQLPAAAFTRVGSNINFADGAFDDFAMWQRDLSLDEIKALYSANRSIGTACGL
jgi:hypothetical protein